MKGSTSTMVSNHNPSRPPQWPLGALQASAREVHNPTPTASVEGLPGSWLRPVYTKERHYYPQPHVNYVAICGATTRLPRPIGVDGTYFGRELVTCKVCVDLLGTMGTTEASE